MRNYPDWLAEAVIEDDLPWTEFKKMPMQQFLDNYTLHDSEWVKLIIDNSNNHDILVVLSLDPNWIPDRPVKLSSYVNEWPILFISITEVVTVRMDNFINSINSARTISVAKLYESYNTYKLVIEDIFDGKTEIEYIGDESFLLLSSEKELINL